MSPEMSVKTGYWLSGGFHYSVYMNKLAFLAVSDYIVIFLLFAIIFLRTKKSSDTISIRIGFLRLFVPLIMLQLFLGILYNLVYDFYPKPLLYDFKWVLYLVAGAALPYILKPGSVLLSVKHIIACLFLSSFLDILYVQFLDCCHELPSALGLPPLVETIPTFALLLGSGLLSPVIHLILLGMQLIHIINVLALNQIYLSLVAVGIIVLTKLRVYKSLVLLYFNFCFLVVPIVLILFADFLLVYKPDGVSTRTIQISNLSENLKSKGFGLIGMGYGATYREFKQTPRNDVYAVGTSISRDQEASMDAPVKFIFNTPAAGAIYKYGLLGLLMLSVAMKRLHAEYKLDGWRMSLLYLFYLVMLFPGFLKLTFVTAFMISSWGVHLKMRKLV